jgi:hypothetical protein
LKSLRVTALTALISTAASSSHDTDFPINVLSASITRDSDKRPDMMNSSPAGTLRRPSSELVWRPHWVNKIAGITK